MCQNTAFSYISTIPDDNFSFFLPLSEIEGEDYERVRGEQAGYELPEGERRVPVPPREVGIHQEAGQRLRRRASENGLR